VTGHPPVGESAPRSGWPAAVGIRPGRYPNEK